MNKVSRNSVYLLGLRVGSPSCQAPKYMTLVGIVNLHLYFDLEPETLQPSVVARKRAPPMLWLRQLFQRCAASFPIDLL